MSRIVLNDMQIDVHDVKTGKKLESLALNSEELQRFKETVFEELMEYDWFRDLIGDIAWKGYESRGNPQGVVDQDDPHLDVVLNWDTELNTLLPNRGEVAEELKRMNEYLAAITKEGASDAGKARVDGYIRALKWFLDLH